MTTISRTAHDAPTGGRHNTVGQAGQEAFSTDITGLPACVPTETVGLSDDDVFDLQVAPVSKHIGDAAEHATPDVTDLMVESVVAGSKPASTFQRLFADGRAPLIWGVLWGVIQAAAPFGFWWVDAATVYALSIALIAAVYIGFAVADGRPTVIAVESTVAGIFVVLAAVGITGSAWLLVLGFAAHGLKDLWQHRTHYVANTRWWPPFCMTIDWVAAAIIAVAIIRGVTFHP